MATKNIIPRNNDEGQIGSSSKKWASAHISDGIFDTLTVGGASVTGGGGGSPDLISEGQAKVETIDTGTDARIEFYVDPNDDGTASKAWEITENGHLLPGANDTFDIGSAQNKVRDLYVSQNSLWIGDDHKMSIRSGKISHKKRKKSTNYIPRAFANYLSQGSFNRNKLLAIKKTANGGSGGSGPGGAALNESELTLADWVRYANATQIDGESISNRFRSSKSGGPQEGKWTANDIFDEDDDFEEIIDPSSATNLDLNSFSNDAKATTIDDSSPSATKFVTESAVKNHVDTKISEISLSLNNLSDVDTSGVSSGQVLKWDGSNWTPAADNAGSGGGGGGGSRPTISVVTNSSSNWASNVFTVPDAASTSVLEIVYLVNLAQSTTQSIKLPDATLSVNDGFKIQIKRIGTDPVNIITHSNTQKIDNVANASISLPHQYSSLTLMCNQSTTGGAQGWWIV